MPPGRKASLLLFAPLFLAHMGRYCELIWAKRQMFSYLAHLVIRNLTMDISRLLWFIHVGLLRRLQNRYGSAYSANAAVRAGGAAFDGDTAAAGRGAAADAAILHDHQIVVIGREWIGPIEADSGRNLCAGCNRDNHNIYGPRLTNRKHIQFAGKQ